MSKTVRNNDEFSQKNRGDADKQKVPTPYPPVEPTVAEQNPGQKER